MSDSALTLLAPLAARGMVLDLSVMRAALDAVGRPERATPCVHIAGTNGKGSVSALVTSVLVAAGLRVGTYTSPHLHRFVERVALDGRPVSEAVALRHARDLRNAMARGAMPTLTFFEAATVLSWLVFREARVDLAVVEVGLGGRLDATRECLPRVTAITRIARDHEALLGDTLGAIAREKAGILKSGVPCVLGPALGRGSGEARDSIEAVAETVGAPLVDAKPAVRVTGRGRVAFAFAGVTVECPMALSGAHQYENLATALSVLEALRAQGVGLTPDAVAAGVAAARWPARVERLGDVIFDAAHNPDGIEALVRALPDALDGARVAAVVFGASRDKDWRRMAATLGAALPEARWVCTAAAMARAEDAAVLAEVTGGDALVPPDAALDAARARCGPGEVVLVCGSIFVVAAARAHHLGIETDPPIGL